MKISSSLAFGIVSFLSFEMTAQDMIHKTDESVISSKVMEINSTSVKYKLYGNTNEAMYELPKNDIHYIIYQNGTRENYNTNVTKPSKPETITSPYVESADSKRMDKESPKEYGKNIIALNCFDMVFTNFSASYERILKSGDISIKIPISIGLQGRPNTTNYTSDFYQTQFLQNRNYAAGLDLNIYPFGQKRNTFYIGLSTFGGTFKYYKDITTVNVVTYGGTYTSIVGHTEYEGVHYSGMIHIGGYGGLSDHFLMGAKFGIGFKREDTIEEDYTLPVVQFDFNLAYRF